MKKRGKVLRDPRTGPGLLMIEGRQYWFCFEGIWKSEIPPKPGLTVEVKLDDAGRILAINAVSESQLAEEQAKQSVRTAKAGANILRKIAAKCGMPNLLRR
jgi:predicted molibdopterin-dependent oxidoreductase YjgC